jgi:hypothetical protein
MPPARLIAQPANLNPARVSAKLLILKAALFTLILI